jgi:eukaryotic-like serine/threonine-protein kinase
MADAPPDSPADPGVAPAQPAEGEAQAGSASPGAAPIPLAVPVNTINTPGTPIPEGVAAVLRATRDPLIGTNVLGYEVKKKIGSGGMGIVYEGEQATIGKRVAIKVLRPEMADKPEQVEALAAEARAVNRVGHRGIVDVFQFGVLPDGRQAIVMELLEGESLQDIITKNKNENLAMPVGEVMLILEEVLSALDAAHGAGVIHRDIKPSNIFLCTQRGGTRYVKLLDFGIAKLESADAKPKTNPSMIMGTPAYMAPEQAFKGKVTPAADLYAVGIIAFELLTNRPPFTTTNVVELLYAHAQTAPPKPSEVLMSIPDEVDDIVLSLLQKQPEDRPQTANVVRMEVKRARKLLLHSTAHPELKLTRDKATGKLRLEERPNDGQPLMLSGGPSQPIPAPATNAGAPKRTSSTTSSPKLQLARTRSVGATPAVTGRPSKKLAPLEPGEVTVPSDHGPKPPARPSKPDDATFVPGRLQPVRLDLGDATIVPGRVQPVTLKNEPVEAPPPTEELGAAAGTTPWLKILVIVAAIFGVGGAAIYFVSQKQKQQEPRTTVIQEIKPPPAPQQAAPNSPSLEQPAPPEQPRPPMPPPAG